MIKIPINIILIITINDLPKNGDKITGIAISKVGLSHINLVVKKDKKANGMAISNSIGVKKINTPNAVDTPFPPLNL